MGKGEGLRVGKGGRVEGGERVRLREGRVNGGKGSEKG